MSMYSANDNEDEILAQINVIPLVDVSLVLLIIFIVTVNQILTPSIKIKLPQSAHAATLSEVGSINVSVSSEGVIYLDNAVVTLKELEEKLTAMHTQNPDKGIVLSVDKSVYFQRVVDALDVINATGLSKIDIKTIRN